MDKFKLEAFWNDIPIGKENAITYPELIKLWGYGERAVRSVLHELSEYDNGDNYVLVRSASAKGFFRTDDKQTILSYKKECLNKGTSVFTPIKKINRVLNANTSQYGFSNNLRVVREGRGLCGGTVVEKMRQYDEHFDKALLSKMENDRCLPTPYQLQCLSNIYGCSTDELINVDLYL